jgi:uncharacterized membrane protein YbhN (UPF0104 family)
MSASSDLVRPRSWVRPILQFALGLGLFIGLVVWAVPSWADFRAQLSLSIGWLAVSTLGSLLATFVTAARWKILSEAMGVGEIRYGVYFHYLALTRVLGQVLPSAVVDVLGRGAALKAAGSKSALGNLMAPVVLERMFDLLLPLCMLGWALLVHVGPGVAHLGGPWGSLTLVVVAFGVLGVALLRPLVSLALWALGRLRRLRGKTGEYPEPPPVSTRLGVRIMGLSILRYAGILVQYWGAGAGVGVVLGALTLVSAAPLAQLAGLIGITPGGLGIQEGGWVAGLSQLGEDPAAIAVFMMGTRLMMIVSFGIFTLASWRWRKA